MSVENIGEACAGGQPLGAAGYNPICQTVAAYGLMPNAQETVGKINVLRPALREAREIIDRQNALTVGDLDKRAAVELALLRDAVKKITWGI